jgi:serine/threonine protein kinase
LVGRTLGGRYTLTELLGRGGFDAVFHALQAPIERPVAVKVISGGQDPADLRRRFLLEARAAPHPRRARSPATPVDHAKVDTQLRSPGVRLTAQSAADRRPR